MQFPLGLHPRDQNQTATIRSGTTTTRQMAIRLRIPEDFSAVEVLGMLEASKLQIYRDMGDMR